MRSLARRLQKKKGSDRSWDGLYWPKFITRQGVLQICKDLRRFYGPTVRRGVPALHKSGL